MALSDSNPERLYRIEAALLKLAKMDREIFLAMRLEGRGVSEIARITRLSPRQVERRLGRAYRILARELGDLS